MDCEFCKKEFSTKTNLSVHQKTAKYCLTIQGRTNEKYKCSYCVKLFTTQQQLDKHDPVCKIKQKNNYENELKTLKDELTSYKKQEKIRMKEKDIQIKDYEKKLEKQIQEYEKKLEIQRSELEKQRQDYEKKLENQRSELEKQKQEYKTEMESTRNMIINEKNEYIAKLEARLDKFESAVVTLASEPKTTKTTNNVVVNNNTLNLSTEHVTKVLEEHFTKEVVAGGQKKLAEMVYEKMLKGPDGKSTYVCVDPSRQTFEFINNDGDVERDVKAKKLTKALINSNMHKKAAEVGNQIWTKADGHVDSTLYEYCSPKVMELACFDRDDSKFRSELSALTS